MAAWWEQLKVKNFSSLVPNQKLQEEKRNIRISDIVLLSYKTKRNAGTYRLGLIVDVTLEDDGLVCTVFVTYSLLKTCPARVSQLPRAISLLRELRVATRWVPEI